jgi:hypothetical protein
VKISLIRSAVLSIAVLTLGTGTLNAQAEEAGCGAEPTIARAAVLGRLRGEAAKAGNTGPWAPFTGVKPDSVQAIVDAAACEGFVMMLTEAGGRAATDTLPLQGIINLGDLGVVIVRGKGPAGTRGTAQSMTLMDVDFKVLRYDRFQF